MTIERAIYAVLAADVGVGSLAGDKIRPLVAFEDDATPYVVYQRITSEHHDHLSGTSGLARARVQVTAWGNDYGEAKVLATAVRAALDDWSGTAGGQVVSSTRLESMTDIGGVPTDGPEKVPAGVAMDFSLFYTE